MADLEKREAEHLAKFLSDRMDEAFGKVGEGKTPNARRETTRHIFDVTKVDHGTLQKILAADGGAGIAVLIKLRKWMQVSIDDMLGLTKHEPLKRPPEPPTESANGTPPYRPRPMPPQLLSDLESLIDHYRQSVDAEPEPEPRDVMAPPPAKPARRKIRSR